MAGRVIAVSPGIRRCRRPPATRNPGVVGQRQLLGRLGRIGRVGIGQRDELVLGVVAQRDPVAVGVLLVIQLAVGKEDVLRAGGVGEGVNAAGLASACRIRRRCRGRCRWPARRNSRGRRRSRSSRCRSRRRSARSARTSPSPGRRCLAGSGRRDRRHEGPVDGQRQAARRRQRGIDGRGQRRGRERGVGLGNQERPEVPTSLTWAVVSPRSPR